ncbi:MAG: phosphotransferase [Planctomycetota bacterium]|nr:phosphotransferase [Planctomycetota bacterium]
MDDSDIPILSGEDIRQLDGSHWRIHGKKYVISSGSAGIDHRSVQGGNESRVVPLLDESGQVVRLLKTSLKSVSPRRASRIQWLAEQRLSELSPGLSAAPCEWIDTRECGRPENSKLDFTGYFMAPVPGNSWLEFKIDIARSEVTIHEQWRRKWVCQFLRTLVALENRNFVHGDLSPGNVMVSAEHPIHLSLIDFDAFVAPDAGAELARLTSADGGMIGTPGYMPIDLERRSPESTSIPAPYSDRRARDMLLLEFLCFDSRCPDEDPVSEWDWSLIDEVLEDRSLGQAERYLRRPEIIDLPETSRVTSAALARAMNVSLKPVARRRYQHSTRNASNVKSPTELPGSGPGSQHHHTVGQSMVSGKVSALVSVRGGMDAAEPAPPGPHHHT